MPSDLFTFTPNEYSGAVILFNLTLSFALSSIIVFVYKKTHRGLSYSQSFFITIVMICVISTSVIMVVQNNIFGALGLLGALAVIRFRTIVKETRDISFVFFSLAEGVAVGSGNYPIAIFSTIFVSLVTYILWRFNIGSVVGSGHILSLSSVSPLEESNFYSVFKERGMNIKLLNSKKVTGGDFEYTFSIAVSKKRTIDSYISALRDVRGIRIYDIIAGRDSEEF